MRNANASLAVLPASGIVHAAEFRVNDCGAKGDGETSNTTAIPRAIDAAAKTRGTVVFGPGVHVTGSNIPQVRNAIARR